jgi:hypothetical protein
MQAVPSYEDVKTTVLGKTRKNKLCDFEGNHFIQRWEANKNYQAERNLR